MNTQRTCDNPECRQTFTPPSRAPYKRFCSRPCAARFHQLERSAARKAASAPLGRPRILPELSGHVKPLSPEFLAKWERLKEQARLDAIQAREEAQRAEEAARVRFSTPLGDNDTDNDLEDWAFPAARPKVGLKPAITCSCGRTVLPGSARCWRHQQAGQDAHL